jgi:hypothetical protein
MGGSELLQCVKPSWSGHIAASTIGFAVWCLMISSDNGLAVGRISWIKTG